MSGYTLPERLRSIRLVYGLTQSEVAEGIGISRHQYCLIENGRVLLSVDLLRRICRFYKISSDYILNLSEDANDKDFKKA